MGLFRKFKAHIRVSRALREIEARRVTPRPHGLPKPLYISLTSYPARFDVLHLTLRCLLNQTVQPDGMVLWIGEADMAALPAAVLSMQSDAFQIRATRDMRAYTKIIPMLAERPDAFIVTADDDLYYRATWLEDLVTSALQHPGQVQAHRAHRVTHRPDGAMQSYEKWNLDIGRGIAGINIFGRSTAGGDIFATGVGGVLYPPGSLHADTVRSEVFTELSPYNDDIWLYWMARRQGSVVRHLGPRFRVLEWPGSQHQSLRAHNRGKGGENRNDVAIAAMIAAFGKP
ncbi:MAG: glycosyltransferase family 2 protein [Pseudomonadota bacterium]